MSFFSFCQDFSKRTFISIMIFSGHILCNTLHVHTCILLLTYCIVNILPPYLPLFIMSHIHAYPTCADANHDTAAAYFCRLWLANAKTVMQIVNFSFCYRLVAKVMHFTACFWTLKLFLMPILFCWQILLRCMIQRDVFKYLRTELQRRQRNPCSL